MGHIEQNEVTNAAKGLHDHGCTTCGTDIPLAAEGAIVNTQAASAPLPQQEECHSCGH